jgi:hypothetical protein
MRGFNKVMVSAALVTALARVSVGGTVGQWRFEGTAGSPATAPDSIVDSSGNGLHGTPSNSPTYSGDVPALGASSATSLQFDGGQTRVFVPDAPALQLTHSITIEAFVKSQPMQPGTGPLASILFRGDNRPGQDPYLLYLSGGNQLSFQIDDPADNYALVTAPIAFDEWTHVAGTLDDATGEMKLFVNRVLVASTITSLRPLALLDGSPEAGIGIGSDQTGQYGFYLNGWLDEVRLSDTALTPAQFLPEPGCLSILMLSACAMRRKRA